MKPLLPGKVAIINGGATGMGRSCAYLFAEEGCNCVIADVNEEEGKKTAAEASKKGAEAIFIKCDITDLQQIKDCVDQTVKRFGMVHILIGSAGGSVLRDLSTRPRNADGTPKTGIEHTDENFFDMMMDLNYNGHVFFCKEVAPYFKKQNFGKIVLISSMGVYSPPGTAVEYHGAKAAIIGLVLNLAYELGPSGVNVNGILPGPIKTPFWDPVLPNMTPEERSARMDMIGQSNPMEESVSRRISAIPACSWFRKCHPLLPDRCSALPAASRWVGTAKADSCGVLAKARNRVDKSDSPSFKHLYKTPPVFAGGRFFM